MVDDPTLLGSSGAGHLLAALMMALGRGLILSGVAVYISGWAMDYLEWRMAILTWIIRTDDHRG